MAPNAIKEHHVRFVRPDATGSGPAPAFNFTEQDHERAALLGKIIHFESFLSLYLTGLPGARSWDEGQGGMSLSVSPNTSYVPKNSTNPVITIRSRRNPSYAKFNL
jgi:hypothetical protein